MHPLPAAVIFLATYALIASERVDKTVAAVLGAAVVIFFHLVPYETALSKVDLNVLYLLVGMMVVVNILATTGCFEYIAVVVAQKARGDAVRLLLFMLLVTAFISAFLDNVTTIILIAPVTILMTQILDIPAAPFLILEAVFSNIGGTATLVGDPPNIVIGSQTHLYFKDFLVNLAPVVVVIAAVSVTIVILLMGKRLQPTAAARERVAKAEPRRAIVDAPRLRRALPVLGLVVVGFFFSHALGIETGLMALAGAFVMVLVCGVDVHQSLARVEWSTIFFFIGLFMLVGTLEFNGVFDYLGKHMVALTHGNLLACAILLLWSSAILSAIVDNIPLVIAMIPLIKSSVPMFAAHAGLAAAGPDAQRLMSEPLFWALALGACLGGNGTLVGASANVVVVQIARRNGYRVTFAEFSRYGLPLMFLSIAMATVYLYLRYF